MITGVHALMYAEDAQAARAFLRDVLGWPHVEAGEGWLIFAMPPAEVGVHPAGEEPGAANGTHMLYLMCDDVHATVAALRGKGVEFTRPVSDEGWGLLTTMKVPGAGEMGLYQPRHPMAARRV